MSKRAFMKTFTKVLIGLVSCGTAFAARTANAPLSGMGVSGGGALSLPMQIALSLTLMVLLPAAIM